jgi:hypothetical protein
MAEGGTARSLFIASSRAHALPSDLISRPGESLRSSGFRFRRVTYKAAMSSSSLGRRYSREENRCAAVGRRSAQRPTHAEGTGFSAPPAKKKKTKKQRSGNAARPTKPLLAEDAAAAPGISIMMSRRGREGRRGGEPQMADCICEMTRAARIYADSVLRTDGMRNMTAADLLALAGARTPEANSAASAAG